MRARRIPRAAIRRLAFASFSAKMIRSIAPRLALAVAVVAGCYTGSAVDVNRAPDATEPEPASTADAGKSKGKPKPPPATGLPCDVAAIVSSACGDCHGSTPSNGARNRLVTYDDFSGPAPGDPTLTAAAGALRRMKSESRPMPPVAKLADETIAIFARWIADGLPRGSCADTTKPVPDPEPEPEPAPGPAPAPVENDAGTTDDAGPPLSVCTSGVTAPEFPNVLEWMNPGRACIACHTAVGSKRFSVAGSVYPTLHEPDRCNGVDGADAIRVLIIDHAGNAHTMPVNAAGNFYSFESFPLPYRAMVVRGREIRAMAAAQNEVDCNACHTEWGKASAPGRIMVP